MSDEQNSGYFTVQEDKTNRQQVLNFLADTSAANKALVRLIDSTILKPSTVFSDVKALCEEAVKHNFRSVCIAPTFLSRAKRLVSGTPVSLCTVVGFPNGTNQIETKTFEVSEALRSGADEIDFVQNVAFALEGNWSELEMECRGIVSAAKDKTVKIILETSLLSEKQIVECTKVAALSGVHVIKTSTGFGSRGASLRDVELIAETLQNLGVLEKTGIKASGGIRTREDALKMIQLGATRLGTSQGAALVEGEKMMGSY